MIRKNLIKIKQKNPPPTFLKWLISERARAKRRVREADAADRYERKFHASADDRTIYATYESREASYTLEAVYLAYKDYRRDGKN